MSEQQHPPGTTQAAPREREYRKLTGIAESQAAIAEVVGTAQRLLRIFAISLSHRGFNSPERIEQLRKRAPNDPSSEHRDDESAGENDGRRDKARHEERERAGKVPPRLGKGFSNFLNHRDLICRPSRRRAQASGAESRRTVH